MKATGTVAALAALLLAGTSSATQLEFPESFPLHKRQDVQPGTPQYSCHAACGGVLTIARTDDFCENPDYDSQLSACLKCANTFNIWQYYGRGVAAAASQCGDSAEPSPSGDSDTPPATPSDAAPSSQESTPAPTVAPPASSGSTGVSSQVTSAPVVSTGGSSASEVPSASPTSEAANTPTPMPTFTGAASSIGIDHSTSFIAIVLGAFGFLL